MQRLNDIINPEQSKNKIYQLRNLKNSFLRNMIEPFNSSKNKNNQEEYQSKLSNYNFRNSDLIVLFTHLYSKEGMSVSDRNLIRKILLMVFQEGLVLAAGKGLVKEATFIQFRKSETAKIAGGFYFLLQGSVTLKSKHYSKQYKNGDYFGHIQLISRNSYNSPQIHPHEDSYALNINTEYFNHHLLPYFQQQYIHKIKAIPQVITLSMQRIPYYLLLEELEQVKFDIGEKIVRKNQQVREFLMVSQGKISDSSQKIQYANRKLGITVRSVGFGEYFSDKSCYDENIYALTKVKAYKVSVQAFQKYVSKFIVMEIKDDLRQATNTSKIQKQKQKSPKLPNPKNFMRVRQVKLTFQKRLKTTKEQTQSRDNSTTDAQSKIKFVADFRFVKKMESDRRYQRYRVNRSLFGKSLANSEVNFSSLNNQI